MYEFLPLFIFIIIIVIVFTVDCSENFSSEKSEKSEKSERKNARKLQKPYHPILISGTGGAGNTEILRTIFNMGAKTNEIGDADGLKHTAFPPDSKIVKKAVYIYGYPPTSVHSIYRRWAKDAKLLVNEHFHQMGSEYNLPSTYSKFVQETDVYEKDITGIFKQFENWSKGSPHYPIFMLNFSEYDKVKDKLHKFLGYDLNLKVDKARYTKYDNDRKKYETVKFQKMYDNWFDYAKAFNGKIV